MPLARIITDSVDDSLELTIQLRARGFQVETVAPGAVPNTPADLEVRLEECAPEEVLSRAAETPTQEDLWVFVAPGALDDRVRVIRELPVEPVSASEAKGVAPARPLNARAVAPVIPFLTPEDDPILAELAELRTSAEDSAQKHPQAEEPSRDKAEVVVFPAAAPPHEVATVASGACLGEAETSAGTPAFPGPVPSANLLFWRIATVAAGLAIAALLVGANMSREPNHPPAPILAGTMAAQRVPSTLPQRPLKRQAQKVVAKKTPPATNTKGVPQSRPSAQVVKATRTAPHRRPTAGSQADSIIAEDTVVFYDRKPSPPAGRTGPVRKGSGRN